MKYEFGVAWTYHCSGADAKYLGQERFETYEDAKDWACENIWDCTPTIYLIVNDKYAFYPQPFADGIKTSSSRPLVGINFIESVHNVSYTVKTIYWEYFSNHAEEFFHLAQKI